VVHRILYLPYYCNKVADYDKVIARYRSEGWDDATKDMRIVPVNFNAGHKAMLGH
jgi:hypothetical protein